MLTATQLGDRIGFKAYGVNRVLSALGWSDEPLAHGARDKGAGTLIWPLGVLDDPSFVQMMNKFLAGPDADAVLKTGDPRRSDEKAFSKSSNQASSTRVAVADGATQPLPDRSDERLEVLNQAETVNRLYGLIDEASTRVLLVSPYTSFDRLRNVKRSILGALKRQLRVSLVVREPDKTTRHTRENVGAIQELVNAGLRLFSLRDLHAKVYLSDNHAILTSLNLLDSSINNSIEIGMSVPRRHEAFQQVLEFWRVEIEPHIKPIKSSDLLR